MDKSLTTKIVAFVVVLFLVLTVFGQIYVRKAGSVGTEVAMRYESRENIEFSAVFIRNEHTVSRHIDGIIRYTHEDGAKLAKNSVAASIYANAADVELCGRIEKLELKIKTLEDAQSLAGTDSSQIEAFNKLINEKHSELIDAIDSGDYKLCGELKYQLLNL